MRSDHRLGPAREGAHGGAALARCGEEWRRAAHAERVSAYQLGYLTRRRRGPGQWWIPQVPLLRIVVEPGRSIDFADPDRGFLGHHRRPPAQRTLKLWGDGLLSVGHGADWMFVVDSRTPFDQRWVASLTSAGRSRAAPGLAVVFASFSGLARPGHFRLADVDPVTYTTLVHVVDHRG